MPDDNLLQTELKLQAPLLLDIRRMDVGARTLTRRGVRAFNRGDREGATRFFGQAVLADPEGPIKRINYGAALRETGHWSSAEEQLAEAIRLSQDGSELRLKAHLEMARLFVQSQRLDEAQEHLETALEIEPESLPCRLELGRLHQARGELDKALVQYAAVRTFDRAVAGTRFWHAALLVALGRDREALASLEEDLDDLGEDRGLRLLLARLLSAAPIEGLRDLARAGQLLVEVDGEPDVLLAETAAMVAATRDCGSSLCGTCGRSVRWTLAQRAIAWHVSSRCSVFASSKPPFATRC